ncbi:EAL domain-containing protein [Methylomarinum sp. Ch1-1]|uniref:EAL domain-containing protein n=1 Tax=Methylomarinum roseum TaxID=3067653 RepID=A0AAU7NZC3_9GAMM|nr:EAL domain-containing protein [Methylomarinum sp. Ch1-1]MDP4521571.1 EAL domain-containing protein [Methylomarinum sp. Ch1-1]
MQANSVLFPCFQPIVSVASGWIVGYEVLARQYDDRQNIVSAGQLFSSTDLPAEQLREVDRQVRWQALQKFANLHDHCYLTLNISAAWIDYVTDIRRLPTLEMLKQLDIDKSRIIIEITEAKADIDKLKEVVNIYRREGLRVAIDDFGSGFSQLERVIALNPDIIKIDMRLFKMAVKGGVARDVVHLLTRFGKRLGSQVVCEGVQTDDEFMFGLNSGAQFMQGFLFAGAEMEFIEADKFQRHIASLRKKFLNRKLQEELLKIDKTRTVTDLLYKLKAVLQDDFNLNALVSWDFEGYGVLRFYLCNSEGEQISPDFNFSDGQWFNDPSKIGFNWSWRPYFYQIIALESRGDCDQVITSDHYKDFDSGLLCKTLSLTLDANRILMVDIKSDRD